MGDSSAIDVEIILSDQRREGMLRWGAAVLLAFQFVPPASAQSQLSELRVRFTSSTDQPPGGALVGLVDASNRLVTEGLTSEAGTILLRAPAGTYTVRVRRIGFLPFVTEPVTLPRLQEFAVRADDRRVTLSTMVITARSDCGKLTRDSEALATVWEEISKALRASQITASDLKSLLRAHVYRKMESAGGRVISSDTVFVGIGGAKPFGAIAPAELADSGYVRGNEDSGWEYFGVDETVLLSPEFADTHCFHLLRDRKRAGQMGMVFEPIPRRSNADVKGVLWLDEETSELREVFFRFTNAGLLSQFNANGFTKFRRLRSGAWIVEEWWLRAPKLTMRIGVSERIRVAGYVEDGGGVILSSAARATGEGKR